MTITIVNIIPPKQAENSQTEQYTVAAGTETIIDKFTVTNTTGGSVNFSCNIVPVSVAVSDSNLIIDTRAIASGETYRCPELVGHGLVPGDFISTLASAATALTIRASGREIT